MTDHPVHRDDIAALRKEGDLPAYIRQLKDEGRARLTTQPSAKPRRTRRRWGAIPIPPDHKPGQWPPGTRPPDPAPERHLPAEDWEAAVHDYRTTQPNDEEPEP